MENSGILLQQKQGAEERAKTGTHFPNRFLIIFAYHSVCSFLLSIFLLPPPWKNNKEPP